MAAKPAVNLPVSAKTPITARGVQGFLLWFQREQPAIYAKVAPQLPAMVPKAFSNYNQYARRKKMGALGDDSSDDLTDYMTTDISSPAVDVSIPSFNPTIDTGEIDPGAVSTLNYASGATPSPVALAANTSPVASPVTTAIGQTIAAASQIYMTTQQAALQQQLVNTNLQRAAAGLPPLNTSLNQLGVPTVASGISSGTMLLIGGGALLLVLLSGKNS